MKKFIVILGYVYLLSYTVFANNINTEQLIENYTVKTDKILSTVQKFKDILKTNNPQLIAQNVIYPFSLGQGLPSVQNEQEFVEKYNIILPEYLRKYFIDAPMEQWGSGENLGGICLNDCPDAHLNDDGKIICIKDSEELKQYRKDYIEKEKQIIHPSLKNYNYNIYTLETKDWLIRIDDMEGLYEAYSEYEKKQHYRLALWKKGKTISDEPDIVFNQGYLWLPEEKNADYIYDFTNEKYFCRFISHTIGPIDQPKYYITLYKMQFFDYPKINE